MRKVELYESIRRARVEHNRGIRRLARDHRVHRREVKRALANAEPRKPAAVRRERPVLGPLVTIIDEILAADRTVPRKQRHTARRIWTRLLKEHGARVSEVSVRRYVRERKRELYGVAEVMVPQFHWPGAEAEVDMGESLIDFPWGRVKVNVFEMRACSSGAVFHWPLRALTQQAFLEAHARAFAHFGGVFRLVRYDNLKLAVIKILRGRLRVETDRFKVMRSHYLFESAYCQPGLRGAHEKGGVEGEVGYFRRNYLVPIPKLESWEELEELCLRGAVEELDRHLDQRPQSIGQDWEQERLGLLPLPEVPLQTALQLEAEVDAKARVSFGRNRYSAPVLLSGLKVQIEASSTEIVIRQRDKEVARHQRVYGAGHDRLSLDHYLEVLRYKPRALAGSLPLKQAIEAGSFPADYQEFRRRLVARMGESEGARQMVDVLFLHRVHPHHEVHAAVAGALEAGAYDYAAVALGVRAAQERVRPAVPRLEVLAGPEVAIPDCRPYDDLLLQRS